MKQLERLEKMVSQRKQRFVRGRPGLNTQMMLFRQQVYAYLLEVNAYLCTDFPTPEERWEAQVAMREAGELFRKEVEQWLVGE